ncbi:MAG: hypothetical protein O3A00_06845 [Planctomycetota bacterium]|nr:hypothetical protein [Planctomycetota bacterium]MDA1014156.1 hypothetical protein [Planctomycetota bacterium]
MLRQLWNDEGGALITMEFVFIATIAVIGMITAWSKVSQALTSEMIDLSTAVGNLKQDYAFTGTRHAETNKELAFVLGSGFDDKDDACDCDTYCDIACGTTGTSGHENN